MKLTQAQQELKDYKELRELWRVKGPTLYAKQRIGMNPTRQQQELFEAIRPPGAKVSVRAAHGVGKTTSVSIAIWWHLECFEFCRIPCTAPTASQLNLVLWSELSKVLSRAEEQANVLGIGEPFRLKNMFKMNQGQIRAIDPDDGKKWYAVARTSRKEQPDALQGFHASDLNITENDIAVKRSESGGALMFVIEEASGVPDPIFQVVEGALSSDDARLIMVGNPVRNTGFFAESHTKHRSSYTTLHFAGKDSPLQKPKYRADLVRKYGEGSNVVRVRADGEFPNQDDDVLIPLADAEQALKREPIENNSGRRILGVDVARFGDDRTTFILRHGRTIEYIGVRAKQDTMVTAGEAISLYRRLGADVIHVDVIGLGAGVVDRLKEQKIPVVAVNVADAATTRQMTKDRKKNQMPIEKFGRQDMIPAKMRDYLWIEMHDWFTMEEPIISFSSGEQKENAEDLVAEVATVRYKFDSTGKITIESKDDMKARDLRSPDLADALALTFSPDRLSVWELLGGPG